MSVAERLGVSIEQIEQVELLKHHVLPGPDQLFETAFNTAQQNPEHAQLLLAAALLSTAQHTAEGRLSGALSLMAPLVARADPMKTLGPDGAQLRAQLLPSGWIAMSKSWDKTRYAWREGMQELLDANTAEDAPVVQALYEITRLHPAEPEPVAVAIQETFPAPKVAFAVTVIGMAFTVRTVLKETRANLSRRRR